MAQTIEQIQAEIIAAKNAEPTLAAINSTSSTAIWRLWTYITASTVFTLQKLFDALVIEIKLIISLLKPHTLRWYANKCLLYQHGFNLYQDSDIYNNAGYTSQQIETSKVVKYAAVVEQTNQYGRVSLRIKLAGETGSVLDALTPVQLAGVKAYWARIKDAGVKLQIDSLAADALMLSLKIYYDPLLLSAAGARLDGQDFEPVQNAIRTYLKNLPFNGQFVLAYLVDAIQAVDGVVIPEITSATAKYGNYPFTAISTEYNPDAGYLKIYTEATDLLLSFVPHAPIR